MLKINQHILTFLMLIFSQTSFAATTASTIIPWTEGKMHFCIESNVPQELKTVILQAVKTINELNIVNLIEVPENYNDGPMSIFTFSRSDTCTSGYGMEDGPNNLIRIGKSCKHGNILHEILHALGFLHEQVNPTRDSHLFSDRVRTAAADQYTYESAKALTKYDVNSIMHYGSYINSICDSLKDPKWDEVNLSHRPHPSCRTLNWKNLTAEKNNGIDCLKECTVMIQADGNLISGQRHGLSELDIEGLNKLYPRQ